MCGRIALTANTEQIKQHFSLSQVAAVLVPRYNIAPTQSVVIVNNVNKVRQLTFVTWGIKLTQPAITIINAKLETVSEKKIFQMAFKQQRCLVVVSGFFEWKTANKNKVPFYVQVKNQPILGLAGILIKDQCVILTQAAINPEYVQNLHPRVPVIISQEHYTDWLDLKTPCELLRSPRLQIDQLDLKIYQVSSQVNKPGFDNPLCLQSLN